jgi:hypothetical protein
MATVADDSRFDFFQNRFRCIVSTIDYAALEGVEKQKGCLFETIGEKKSDFK